MNHVTEQPKGCVRFQTMLDDIAPGLYNVAYRNLSRIAHGNMVFGFRGDMSASTSQSALLRPKKTVKSVHARWSQFTPALQFNIATGGMAASEPHESKQSKRTLSLRFTMPSSFNPTICVLPH